MNRHNSREAKQASEYLEKLLHKYLDLRPANMDQKDGVLILTAELSITKHLLDREWKHFVSKWNHSPKRKTELKLNYFMEQVEKFDEKIRINIWMVFCQAKLESYYGIENCDKTELLRLYNNHKMFPDTACGLFAANVKTVKSVKPVIQGEDKKAHWFITFWKSLTAKLSGKKS